MIRALVIDDDARTEALLADYFARLGGDGDAVCAFARSDREAMEIITSGAEFDVALIAVDRSPISGVGLFHQITDRTFRVPRIALSSGQDIGLIRRAMNEGAVDFMVKPLLFNDFEATLLRILETVARRRKNWQDSAAYSALKKEIDIAADIQQRILPTRFPAIPGYEIAAHMLPARVMGGDFFDVFTCENGDIGFVVADVSGKGVPAAFYMAVARTLIHSAAQSTAQPADCLRQVNELLCNHQIPGMFVSVFYGRLNTTTHTVTYANGGHQLPFRIGQGTPAQELHGGDGVVLGVMTGLDYQQAQVRLQPGEFLFVFTDGVTEAFDGHRQAFGEDRLAACLDNLTHVAAAEGIDRVSAAIDAFVGDADQHDDITSLIVRRL
ncbi:MAG: SpoIIE family protein phosphatase [Rhodospirillales bacterium]|nr:SpoIIE family protein phosphatase [Rhodospirillales bacterium]